MLGVVACSRYLNLRVAVLSVGLIVVFVFYNGF